MDDDLTRPSLSYVPGDRASEQRYVESLGELPSDWLSFARPAEVTCEWHRKENQLQMGSCQGTELSSVLERLWFAATGEIVQLSKIFAYLATQAIGGRIGADNGSKPTDGAQLATQYGVPLESLTGYPPTYPNAQLRAQILSKTNYAAAAKYKAKSAVRMRANADEACNLIGGGGGISFGSMWYPGMIPRDRIVRVYNPPRGTVSRHAQCILGYRPDLRLYGWNSHNDGQYEFTPEAYEQMVRHPETVAIGLLGGEQPVDWYADSYMLGKG